LEATALRATSRCSNLTARYTRKAHAIKIELPLVGLTMHTLSGVGGEGEDLPGIKTS
jgi:hypothetical protein